MEDLRQSAEPDLIIMLVGNKVDLVKSNPSMRKVSREEAIRFAQENGLLFEETSAVLALNVIDVFEKLLQGKVFLIFLVKLNRNLRNENTRTS